MRFNVLGSIEARESDRELSVGGGRQLALLALLLVHAGATVSRDRLIDELWAGSPPASAARSLDAYVSRLRRAMRDVGGEGEGLLITRTPGYVLQATDTDVAEFEALTARAREAPPVAAAALLRQALAVWRGRPLPEVADEPWARTEVERLDELRLAAIEARVDADLAIGRHAELVAELEVLAVVQPTRELIVAQLMLALYRSGRQSEALAVYRRARATLVDEFGLEPGPELHGREAAVLAHDPGLDLAAPRTADTQAPSRPPRPEVTPAPSPPLRSGRRPRRTAVAVTAVGLIAAVIAAVAVVLSGSANRPLALRAEGAGALDPASGRVLTSVEVGADPAGIASAGGRVWVINGGDGTLTRVESRDGGHVDQTVKVGSAPVGVTGAWVSPPGRRFLEAGRSRRI